MGLDEANNCKESSRYFSNLWVLGLVFVFLTIKRKVAQIQGNLTHILIINYQNNV